MFTLELDMRLYFVPLMNEHGAGISVTKAFELPFAPSNEVALTGVAFGEGAQSEGFRLTDVAWDVDRKLFLATTSLTSVDFPIPMIPSEIAMWISRGWQMGSLAASYEPKDDEQGPANLEDDVDPWEEAEKLAKRSPRSRPIESNRIMRAIAREMAELSNNLATAYAMDKTLYFFSDDELKATQTPPAKRFRGAQREFDRMSFDQQVEWSTRMTRKRPSLSALVSQY